jgi:hypothetical protein
MKGFLALLALLALAGFSAVWAGSYESELNPAIDSKTLEAGEKAAGASLLGQFKTSSAANLYARADLYLHGGVELRPMSRGETNQGVRNAQVAGNQAQQLGSEADMVTSIPSPERDWRGFIGDMDRATGAYKDMHGHTHNDPGVTFPLFRLMTWIDPHFITGWTTGSMMLTETRTREDAQKSIDFLKQGLAANPESIDILTRIGVLHAQQMGEVREGLRYFNRALKVIHEGKIGPEDQDAEIETYRWLCICYDNLGDRETLKRIADEGIEKFPDDQVILRIQIQRLGRKDLIPKDP